MIVQVKEENEYLRAENEYLKKIESLNSGKGPTTKQKVIVVDELRHKYLLKVLLKISGLKQST